jgi:CO/xanthine dehydrogenase FAD-binding subunit
MEAFEYANPATLQEALGLLAPQWGHTDVLAGGTDLLSLMKDYIHTPKRVVNIKGIKELQGIQKTAAGLRIGALVTMDELATNADIRNEYKSLADAAGGIPSPQIRHMGTAATCASARAAGITGRDSACWRRTTASRWFRMARTSTMPFSAAVRLTL